MQPKVSMVIPCYNKEKEISRMFDSVIAQTWDNIELILVNDGSTDGTRDIIAMYEPKFLKRGYEVKITDQQNKGLPLTVREGLSHISGEYVCQVDADDELDPRYVSSMAGWLFENPDYDWVSCDICCKMPDGEMYINTFPSGIDTDLKIENVLFWKICMSIVKFMIRTEFLQSCNVLSYYTEKSGSQESQLIFPLLTQGGKIKHINESLYTADYSNLENHLMSPIHSFNDYERAVKYYSEWYVPVNRTIRMLPISEYEKERLGALSRLAQLSRVTRYAANMETPDAALYDSLISEYAKLVETDFGISASILEKYFIPENTDKEVVQMLLDSVEDSILGIPPAKAQVFADKIYAWGVLGRCGRLWLKYLYGTALEPGELWDGLADGESVLKPDTGKLTSDDMVLIFPLKPSMVDEIKRRLESVGCNTMEMIDILAYIRAERFPEIYSAEAKFTTKIVSVKGD